MSNLVLRFISIVIISSTIVSCENNNSTQNSFENDLINLSHLSISPTRDGVEAKAKLTELINSYTNRDVTNWICNEVGFESNPQPCIPSSESSSTFHYELNITAKDQVKRYYLDSIVFSGKISKINVNSIGIPNVEVSNVTINSVSKP
jgi:hypothetical protein